MLSENESLPKYFLQVATTHKRDVAIRPLDGSAVMTYGLLYASICSVVDTLKAEEINAAELVGLLIDRSEIAIIGLLSIVIAGGAYVPLDPSYPTHRLNQIIGSAKLRLVLVQASSQAAEWLKNDWPKVRALNVTVDRTRTTHSYEQRVSICEQKEDRLLYVLFTSGSTGLPKAVPGFQLAVIKRLNYWWKTFPYAPGETTLHHITYNWVDHVMEVWNTLLAGREMIVVPNVAALLQVVDCPPDRIRRLWLVPSTLRAILDRLENNQMQPPPAVSNVVTTGEPLPATLLVRYRRIVPQGTLVNVYGMTEVRLPCECIRIPAASR